MKNMYSFPSIYIGYWRNTDPYILLHRCVVRISVLFLCGRLPCNVIIYIYIYILPDILHSIYL